MKPHLAGAVAAGKPPPSGSFLAEGRCVGDHRCCPPSSRVATLGAAAARDVTPPRRGVRRRAPVEP
jgi:hypothetical protein